MSRIYIILVVNFLIGSSVFAADNKAASEIKPGMIFKVNCGKAVMEISKNGGRIVSFQHGNQEFLTQSSEHENFGSTLWSAPQSNWGWPPFEVLDNREYKVEKVGDILKMTSDPDPKSGFQFKKTWQAAENNSIRIEYLIKNISGKAKSVDHGKSHGFHVEDWLFSPMAARGKFPNRT